MSRKDVIGKCRICREIKKLTYEHVPPKVTFNNKKVYSIEGEKVINYLKRDNSLPWEMDGIRKTIHQQGRGGMYLCANCNSLMGEWYVPYYRDFIYTISQGIYNSRDEDYQVLEVKMKGMHPLPIIKQVIAMFCDINSEGFVDDSITNFLLNKESRAFDTERYRIYMHIHSGMIERMDGFTSSVSINPENNEILALSLSELSVFPIGFTIYEFLPKNYTPEGVEITNFLNWEYGDKCIVELAIPKLECNTLFPGDYRKKDAIIQTIQKTKEDMEKIIIEQGSKRS